MAPSHYYSGFGGLPTFPIFPRFPWIKYEGARRRPTPKKKAFPWAFFPRRARVPETPGFILCPNQGFNPLNYFSPIFGHTTKFFTRANFPPAKNLTDLSGRLGNPSLGIGLGQGVNPYDLLSGKPPLLRGGIGGFSLLGNLGSHSRHFSPFSLLGRGSFGTEVSLETLFLF